MTEKEISKEVLLKNPTLFRNDNGTGYSGGYKKYQIKKDGVIPVRRGDVILINPKYFTYGLCPGSGDYVGWEEIEITQDMVGTKIAKFVSIEVKTINDSLSEKQRIWNKAVMRDGGKAEVWKDTGHGIQIITGEEIV